MRRQRSPPDFDARYVSPPYGSTAFALSPRGAFEYFLQTAMRSAAVLLLKRSSGGTRRAIASTRTSARREPLPVERRLRESHSARTTAEQVARAPMPARPRLSRCRPLRVIPRGVVPYLKH
jgi:hypothetical protein